MTAVFDQAKLAVIFLTRLPLQLREPPPLASAMRFFPLVGAAIGLVSGGIYALAHLVLPPWPAAFLALAASMSLTGALHEDGLADCADGFGGGGDRDTKLRIMRDSAIGTYGALALMVSVLLRASALAALQSGLTVMAALMAAHAIARSTLPIAMLALPAASDKGVAAAAGKPAAGDAGQAAMLALAVTALLLPGRSGAAAIVAAGAIAAWFGWLARRQIGGYTGDVLGAIEQLAEIAALLAILAAHMGSP